MMLHPSQAPALGMTRRTLLGCLGFAGLAGAGLLWQKRPNRWRQGFTIHLMPPDPGTEEPRRWQGLQWVIQAHLATLAPACVVNVSFSEDLLPEDRRAFQLQLRPGRQGDLLGLGCRWRRTGSAWSEVPGKPLDPAEAVSALLAALPEPFAQDREARLLPRLPALAWELLDLASADAIGRQARLDRLVAQAPGCALAWCLSGSASHQELLGRSGWTPQDRAQAQTRLERALDLVPGLPLAAGALSQMFSDFGENKAALKVLARAIHIHPYSEVLLRRLAYAARNAGLLEVAHPAVIKREAWMGHLGGIENTLLYLGEFTRFEEGILTQVQNDGWGAPQRFFLGYAALMREDRNTALQRLREAEGQWSEARFGRIGFTLWTFLEGQRQESLAALEKLVQRHLMLRTPDGEFILKLAEMMVLHGQEYRAMDLAIRAASHGFGCVQWYERSPLLAPIRRLPRFQALLHTLRERQAAQADHFPPRAFGL